MLAAGIGKKRGGEEGMANGDVFVTTILTQFIQQTDLQNLQ